MSALMAPFGESLVWLIGAGWVC